MFEFDLTPELVVGIVAAVLAFVFDYFPVLADWYNGLDSNEDMLNLTPSLEDSLSLASMAIKTITL